MARTPGPGESRTVLRVASPCVLPTKRRRIATLGTPGPGRGNKTVDNIRGFNSYGNSETYALRNVRKEARSRLDPELEEHGPGPGRGNKRDDNVRSFIPYGNSETYTISRLKRARPGGART